MKRLILVTPLVAATALLCTPAGAHHSMAMFDMSKVEVIEGKVAKLEWTNPHMYLTVETKGPDGKPVLIDGEGLGTMWGQELAQELFKEAGFANCEIHNVDGDFINVYYVLTK